MVLHDRESLLTSSSTGMRQAFGHSYGTISLWLALILIYYAFFLQAQVTRLFLGRRLFLVCLSPITQIRSLQPKIYLSPSSVLWRFSSGFVAPQPWEGFDRMFTLAPHPAPTYSSTDIESILAGIRASQKLPKMSTFTPGLVSTQPESSVQQR